MKQSVIVYLATLIIAFPLDFMFLRTGRLLFGENAREVILDGPRSAIPFYVLYVACIVSFVNGASPEDWTENASRGAQLGLFFYAAFELASIVLLKYWKWAVMVPDVAWGATLTALAASVGGLLASWILTKV
jgi:uncharacterized membrane protein